MCGEKTRNGAIYCSKACEDRHYDYIEVSIPTLWIKHSILRMNCEEKEKDIKAFAKRHNYDLDLVLLKLKRDFDISLCKDYI